MRCRVMNVEKTSIMSFGSTKRLSKLPDFEVHSTRRCLCFALTIKPNATEMYVM